MPSEHVTHWDTLFLDKGALLAVVVLCLQNSLFCKQSACCIFFRPSYNTSNATIVIHIGWHFPYIKNLHGIFILFCKVMLEFVCDSFI